MPVDPQPREARQLLVGNRDGILQPVRDAAEAGARTAANTGVAPFSAARMTTAASSAGLGSAESGRWADRAVIGFPARRVRRTGQQLRQVSVRRKPAGPNRWTGVSAAANSRSRWRHTPQGVQSIALSAATASAVTRRPPAETIAPSAETSAHQPCSAAFSTFAPAKMRPCSSSNAAPTGKCEYGA